MVVEEAVERSDMLTEKTEKRRRRPGGKHIGERQTKQSEAETSSMRPEPIKEKAERAETSSA
jgi:hypothetical protein